MDVSFKPLTPEIAREIVGRVDHRHLMGGAVDPAQYVHACIADLSYAVFADGVAVGMGGIIPQWPGRAVAWSLSAGVPLRAWPAITRMVRSVMQVARSKGYWRIEATVDPSWPAACRWARRLGFEAYGLLESYTPEGRDLIGVASIERAAA